MLVRKGDSKLHALRRSLRQLNQPGIKQHVCKGIWPYDCSDTLVRAPAAQAHRSPLVYQTVHADQHQLCFDEASVCRCWRVRRKELRSRRQPMMRSMPAGCSQAASNQQVRTPSLITSQKWEHINSFSG